MDKVVVVVDSVVVKMDSVVVDSIGYIVKVGELVFDFIIILIDGK